MNQAVDDTSRPAQALDSGLCALCGIAGYYRIPADPEQLANDNALQLRRADPGDLVRAAGRIGLKARIVPISEPKRIATIPAPAIFRLRSGEFVVFAGKNRDGLWRYVDPITRIDQNLTLEAMFDNIEPEVLLIKRRIGSPGIDPQKFGFRWFWPSLWRYRKPLAHVLLASLFVQIFALVTPIFFQVIVDKVLAHKSNATLLLLIVAIVVSGLFDVILQY